MVRQINMHRMFPASCHNLKAVSTVRKPVPKCMQLYHGNRLDASVAYDGIADQMVDKVNML